MGENLRLAGRKLAAQGREGRAGPSADAVRLRRMAWAVETAKTPPPRALNINARLGPHVPAPGPNCAVDFAVRRCRPRNLASDQTVILCSSRIRVDGLTAGDVSVPAEAPPGRGKEPDEFGASRADDKDAGVDRHHSSRDPAALGRDPIGEGHDRSVSKAFVTYRTNGAAGASVTPKPLNSGPAGLMCLGAAAMSRAHLLVDCHG